MNQESIFVSQKSIRLKTPTLEPNLPGEKSVADRPLKIRGYDQEALIMSNVALIGAGGLGSPIALWLVRKGIGTLTIYDGDTVDLSNLQRQLFYKEDLYKNKAIQLAKNVAKGGAMGTVVNGIPLMFQAAVEQEKVQNFDIGICGVDNDETRGYFARYC